MKSAFQWLGMAAVAWGVGLTALGQGELIPGLHNMGIYGGTIERIEAVAVDGDTTRIFAAFQNPNSVFYADVNPVGVNPFDPTNEVRFRVVPGLAAEENRPIPSHIGVHGASLRLFANVGLGNGHTISSYGVGPMEAVQEVDDLPEFEPGQENVNRSAWAGALVVGGNRVAYTLAENLDRRHSFSICLRDIDPATGWADETNRITMVLETNMLASADEPSMGHSAELAVCPVSGKLVALIFPTVANPLRGKIVVSKSAIGDIESTGVWTNELDVFELPTYANSEWEYGAARWPLRLGVGPDGRVFVVGLVQGTVRVGYSDDGGQSWSAEVNTGIGQGYLGPQMAFISTGGTYRVYVGNGVSTDKGEDGTWVSAGVRQAPCADPLEVGLLYGAADARGLGYSLNALETDPADMVFGDYAHGIEAVEIFDFDFSTDKRVGWTASGQGMRWTTNLNAEATAVVWSAPIMPGDQPSFEAVALDPSDASGNVVIAGGGGSVYWTENGLAETSVWEHVFNGWTDGGGDHRMARIQRMRIKPGDSNVVVVGYDTDLTDLAAINGLMASTDRGATWTNVTFGSGRFLDVKDLLFVGDDLFVAAAYDAAHAGVSGVWRVNTAGADVGAWGVTHELGGGAGEAFHARSLAVDSQTNLFVAGMTTNWVLYGHVENNPLVLMKRAAGGSDWATQALDGLPPNPGPAQPENAFVTVGTDSNETEAVLITFGRGLYALREGRLVRIFQYPFQTWLHVLKWDELTLGSGSGLYAQDTGRLDGNVLYVSPSGSNTAPYDTWEKAAHVIQDALDLARGGDLVWVGDGEYASGGKVTNGLLTRVVVPDYVELRSVNGAGSTLLRGAAGTGTNAPFGPDAVRGAYVGAFARMSGFTVVGGHTDWAAPEEEEGGEDELAEEGEDDDHLSGGGIYVWGGTVMDCVAVSNAAMTGGGIFVDGEGGDLLATGRVEHCEMVDNEAQWGGGGVSIMDGGEVWNALIVGNVAQFGGGAMIEYEGRLVNGLVTENQSQHESRDGAGVLLLDGGSLENCTVVNNESAATNGFAVRAFVEEEEGSGPFTCGDMQNCIVWSNINAGPGWADLAVSTMELVEHSCAPELTAGVHGNLVSDPEFVNAASGDYGLAVGSPCIDSGTNQAWMAEAVDLTGEARIVNAIVDLGAFEFQLAELVVTPTNLTVGYASGSTNVVISNSGDETMVYEVATTDVWLDISTGATGTNSGSATVSFVSQSLTTARTGLVTVTAAGAMGSPVTVTVVQAGAPAYLEIVPVMTNVAAGVTSGLVVEVTANVDWEASVESGLSWLTLTHGTNSGSGMLLIGLNSNTLTTARTGTVLVSGGGISRTCTVTQAGAAASGWDAGYTDLGGGWRRLTWFGDYAVMGTEGWIWHNKHGFCYVPNTSTPVDVWLYAMDMGWLYTGNALYPFLYRASPASWLWYNGATNPRWFMNLTTSQWESRP